MRLCSVMPFLFSYDPTPLLAFFTPDVHMIGVSSQVESACVMCLRRVCAREIQIKGPANPESILLPESPFACTVL